MISRATGEVRFLNGVVFTPQCELAQEHLVHARAHHQLPIPGWTQHLLGEHEADCGHFEVMAISDPKSRILTLFLSHAHPFYEEEAPDDAERRAFHEGVLETELGEGREFSWGKVFCRVDAGANRDWMVVAYESGPKIPLFPPIAPHHLRAHAPLPELDVLDVPFFVPKPAERS